MVPVTNGESKGGMKGNRRHKGMKGECGTEIKIRQHKR